MYGSTAECVRRECTADFDITWPDPLQRYERTGPESWQLTAINDPLSGDDRDALLYTPYSEGTIFKQRCRPGFKHLDNPDYNHETQLTCTCKDWDELNQYDMPIWAYRESYPNVCSYKKGSDGQPVTVDPCVPDVCSTSIDTVFSPGNLEYGHLYDDLKLGHGLFEVDCGNNVYPSNHAYSELQGKVKGDAKCHLKCIRGEKAQWVDIMSVILDIDLLQVQCKLDMSNNQQKGDLAAGFFFMEKTPREMLEKAMRIGLEPCA